MIAPKSRQLAAAVSGAIERLQLPFDGCFYRLGELGVIGGEDRLCARIVLGLRQEIGGDPIRIVVLVGDHQHFRGAGDHVDADGAEDLALGGGNIGIAGTGDLGDGRDGFRCHRQVLRWPARRRCR